MLARPASRPPGPCVPSGSGSSGGGPPRGAPTIRRMAPPLTLDDARRVPKVELHLHVESLSSAATIEALADGLGVPLLRPRGELYRCDSLAELLEACEWWCDLFRTAEIAERIAYGAAQRLHADGVVYAEIAAGPRYWPHLPYA